MTGIRFGTNAEYICLAQDCLLAMKPDKVTDEEATAMPFGGISALHFLRRGKIRPGQKVLIYGASGSVCTFAVQLAKYFGAHVTGVCSTANMELVKSLGADKVIDYTRENFSKGDRRAHDIVFDTVGKSGFWRSMSSLKRGGFYVLARLRPSWMFGGMWASITGAGKVIAGIARTKPGDLNFLKGLIEAGKIRTVIDRRYPLEEIAEAHRYVEAGQRKGNVVITIG
jgi:NADPH:quinone reductase-like Zn-dependent oxidoreductase